MSVPSRDFVSTKGLISLASTYLASIGLRSYTNRNGLAGALATCRTRCEACDSAGIARAGRAVPERILGSMSKKELHGCCDRICSRQRSRVAEQVKGACWLRLRRQAHARLDGVDDANVRFFASVMCLHAPYRAIVRTVRTTTTDTQAPKSYHDGKHAARLQPRCCCTGAQRSACEACSPFFALGLAGPNRSRVPTQRAGSLSCLSDWVDAAVPSDPPIFGRKRNM